MSKINWTVLENKKDNFFDGLTKEELEKVWKVWSKWELENYFNNDAILTLNDFGTMHLTKHS